MFDWIRELPHRDEFITEANGARASLLHVRARTSELRAFADKDVRAPFRAHLESNVVN
jgi:hypothetical protein